MRPGLMPVPARPPWPTTTSALAVVAHPDDESFGLGAVLSFMHASGTRLGIICFTGGEASTLGVDLLDGAEMHHARTAELQDAAQRLGIAQVHQQDFPDGQLSAVPLQDLAALVEAAAEDQGADLLLAFDPSGVTGHPDHVHATAAALAAAGRLGLPVVAWTVPAAVADQLNSEFGTTFVGRTPGEVTWRVPVDRTEQLAAIACHHTQSAANAVLWRRLELTGESEPLLLLEPNQPDFAAAPPPWRPARPTPERSSSAPPWPGNGLPRPE